METCNLDKNLQARDIVTLAHGADGPVIVYDGEDECLVAMSPAMFERILFDSEQLCRERRESLRL